jgi:hypothetical protein
MADGKSRVITEDRGTGGDLPMSPAVRSISNEISITKEIRGSAKKEGRRTSNIEANRNKPSFKKSKVTCKDIRCWGSKCKETVRTEGGGTSQMAVRCQGLMASD